MEKLTENKSSKFKYFLESISLLGIIKLAIMCVAVSNMIWMPTYNNAILLLEDQICGFIMFCFILSGLVSLFGATRMDGVSAKKTLFTAGALAVTVGFGYYLINIMLYALYYQASLRNHDVVAAGINFGMLMCSLYALCLVGIIAMSVINKVKKTKKAKEVK